jgi:CRP/FNR family cyclic AMP-dependent transcriptional regulator
VERSGDLRFERDIDDGMRPRWPGGLVRVFDADPSLLAGVPVALAARLRHQVVTDAVFVDTGMGLAAQSGIEGAFGLLVLDGLLLRRVTLTGRSSVELFGPGDVLRPWQDDGQLASLPTCTTWRALEPTLLALLDSAFMETVHRVPAIAHELSSRTMQRSHLLLARLAIAQMPKLDQRLLALFWYLADRFGRVEPGRVTIPVPISHSVLAELVCAQRPSVSVALKHLIERGEVARRPRGGWVLLGSPAHIGRAPEPVALGVLEA